MPNPFQHPAAEALLERVKLYFKERTVWVLARNQLAFVCGGPVTENSTALRKKFLQWAPGNIEGFRFFVAEVAAKDLTTFDEPRFLNLAHFESVLADVADCIILIPESVGSYAEIGYFAASEKIRRKCLVFNTITEQGNSFLNVGPIREIDLESSYQPTVLSDWGDANFTFVKERLQQYGLPKKRRRLQVDNFEQLSGHEQFAILHYLISIFPSLDIPQIVAIFKRVFSRYRQERMRSLISIMIAADYVRRMPGDEFMIYANPDIPPMLEIDGRQQNELLSENLEFYEKYAPHLIPSAEVRNAG